MTFRGTFMLYQYEHFGKNEYFCKETGVDFSFQPHMHSSFELIIILSGSMDITVGTTEYTVNKNEAVLIFPHQIHSLKSEKSEHMLYIFSPDIIKAFSAKVLSKIPLNSKFTLDEHLLHALHTLNENCSIIEKKGVLYSVAAKFDNSTDYIDRASYNGNLLHRIFGFIELAYNQNCTLKRLSEELAYDHSYLSRYFKSNVGIGFNEYVNQYRINIACEMLTNTDCSVLQCALECGYTSLRSFNRAFHSVISISPSEYKKLQKSK